ncbi:hypothetical protein SNE35_08580 [Paucibacter sp. R3-3]|uniref:Uncharacterized protein n=1 Tax=Roseateles agri TaxID=3098619 RepID=A0ABU5DE49_9BURK|nr:hypothetical protein [Paucibacter sp. R3-3]MDY0744559.1 hypothetical protein [Paucibacter sp. R3-3]
MKTTFTLHPQAGAADAAFADAAAPTSLLAALQDQPDDADALMRAAVQALLQWQLQSQLQAGTPPQLEAVPVRAQLQQFVADCAVGEFGRDWAGDAQRQRWWTLASDALVANLDAQLRLPLHGDFTPARLSLSEASPALAPQAVGPAGYDLVSLLRDPRQPWDEEQQLDWAIRYWEQARKAGLPFDADFGAFWQQLEWAGLQRHLMQAAALCRLKREGVVTAETVQQLLPRLLAHAVKVSTRYIQLSPLARLLEDLQGNLVQTGFTLR